MREGEWVDPRIPKNQKVSGGGLRRFGSREPTPTGGVGGGELIGYGTHINASGSLYHLSGDRSSPLCAFCNTLRNSIFSTLLGAPHSR